MHYYPAYSGMTTAQMLATTTDISGIVSSLKTEITQYAGVNAANVPIIVTETALDTPFASYYGVRC